MATITSFQSGDWHDPYTWDEEGLQGIPGPTDDVVIAPGTVVIISQNVQCHGIFSDGGYITISNTADLTVTASIIDGANCDFVDGFLNISGVQNGATVTLNVDVFADSSDSAYTTSTIVITSNSGTVTINGEVHGGTQTAVQASGTMTLNVNGDISGGDFYGACGIYSNVQTLNIVGNLVGGSNRYAAAVTHYYPAGASVVTLEGNATGGSYMESTAGAYHSASHGLYIDSSNTAVNITGNLYGGSGQLACGLYIDRELTSIVLEITGNIYGGDTGGSNNNGALCCNSTGTLVINGTEIKGGAAEFSRGFYVLPSVSGQPGFTSATITVDIIKGGTGRISHACVLVGPATVNAPIISGGDGAFANGLHGGAFGSITVNGTIYGGQNPEKPSRGLVCNGTATTYVEINGDIHAGVFNGTYEGGYQPADALAVNAGTNPCRVYVYGDIYANATCHAVRLLNSPNSRVFHGYTYKLYDANGVEETGPTYTTLYEDAILGYDYYLTAEIESVDDLIMIETAGLMFGRFVQIADISGEWDGYTPIGSLLPFAGEYNGYDYISGNAYKIIGPSYFGLDSYDGLFGSLSGTVENVQIVGLAIGSDGQAGGLAAEASGATITRCSVRGALSGSGSFGGLCGEASYTSFAECYCHVTTAGGNVGLIGEGTNNTFTNCYHTKEGDTNGSYRTETELKDKLKYINWDFYWVWNIDPEGVINDGYPFIDIRTPAAKGIYRRNSKLTGLKLTDWSLFKN